jgi:hypothetical protein
VCGSTLNEEEIIMAKPITVTDTTFDQLVVQAESTPKLTRPDD